LAIAPAWSELDFRDVESNMAGTHPFNVLSNIVYAIMT